MKNQINIWQEFQKKLAGLLKKAIPGDQTQLKLNTENGK